jgi:hypothetical protein
VSIFNRANHSRFSVCGAGPGRPQTIATPKELERCDDHGNPPLEEYGLPASLAARLLRFLPVVQTVDQLDDLLNGLRQLPRIVGFTQFEQEIINDTIAGL